MTMDVAEAGFSYPSLVSAIRQAGVSITEIGQITGVRDRQVQNSGLWRLSALS